MKNSFFKYIFILFVLAIIIFAIYMIYFRKDSNENFDTSNNVEQEYEVKDLRLGISNFDTINPLLSNNKEVLNIDKLVFEPLMKIDENYKLQNCLAKECSKTSATTYVLKIDNDKRWQDGSQVIAKDVQFTIDRLKEVGSIYSYNVEKVVSVEVLDSETLKINLSEEVPFFEYNLTFPIMCNNNYIGEDFRTTSKLPIGTGMYKIESMDDGNIVLKKNDKWWNANNVKTKIETIVIKKYGQIGEVYNNFKLGNVDIFNTSNSSLEQYIGTIGYTKTEFKGRQYDYLAFNCEEDILQNPAVRKAIACVINKSNIVASVYNNQYYTADFPLDYGNYLYEENITKLNNDIEQAKKILIEDGWEYKSGTWQKRENYYTKRLSFYLTVESENEERVLVAETIKEQLEDVGIKITIRKVSQSQYQKILESKNYEMILTGVYNSYSPDIRSFLTGDNLQNYKNEEMDKLLNEVNNINDENILKEKYKRIQEIYYDQMPFVGLYRNKLYIVKSRSLSGEIKANNYFSYYNLETWNRI